MKIRDISDESVSNENHLGSVIGGNEDVITPAKKKKKRRHSGIDVTLENDTSVAGMKLGNGDARENLNDSLCNGDSSPKVKEKKKKRRESIEKMEEQICYTDVTAAGNADVELSAKKKKKKKKDIAEEPLDELVKSSIETPGCDDAVDGTQSHVDENEGRPHKKKKKKHSLDKTLEDANLSTQAGDLDTSVAVSNGSLIAGDQDLELSCKKKKKRKHSVDNSAGESSGAVTETCDSEVVEAAEEELLHKKHKKKKRKSLSESTESISQAVADGGNVLGNNLPESTNSEGVSDTDAIQKKRTRKHSQNGSSQEDTPVGKSSETLADGKLESASSRAIKKPESEQKRKRKKRRKTTPLRTNEIGMKKKRVNKNKKRREKAKKKSLKKKKVTSDNLAESSLASKDKKISETSIDKFLSSAREEASKPPQGDMGETTNTPQRNLLKNWFKEAPVPSANENIAPEEKDPLVVPEESADNDEKSDDVGFTVLKKTKGKRIEKLDWVLPHWLSNPTTVSLNLADGPPIRSLEGIDPFLLKRLNHKNISIFFPVQAAVIPELLASSRLVSMRYRPRDVCVSAPTGSGKTLAYALPIIQSLLNRVVPQLRALILLPTKELAEQVYNVFVTYTRFSQLKVCLAIAKQSFKEEQESLVFQDSAGNCSADILVATPGRLADHLFYTEGFTLKYVRFFVMDEADLFLSSQGGSLMLKIEQLKKQLHRPIPDNSSICGGFQAKDSVRLPEPFLQQILVSATLVHDPEQLQILDLHRPKLFFAGDETEAGPVKSSRKISTYTRPQELREEYIVVDPSIKPLILSHLISKYELRKVLVFTSSMVATKTLCIVLSELCKDYRIAHFSSLETKRRAILADFSNGKIDVLVASDAMARGIDIPDISQVVSYDVPSVRTYVHRIGRTARAGKKGFALTLVEETPEAEKDFKAILNSCSDRIFKINVNEEELMPYTSQYEDALAALKQKMFIEKRNKMKKLPKQKNQKPKKKT